MQQTRTCTRCLMDTTAKDISFFKNGCCNYCTDFKLLLDTEKDKKSSSSRDSFLKKVKNSRGANRYDCIMGLSGGVDSAYSIYLAKNYGLKPLAVHLDNGWNSELAVDNINRLLSI